MPHNDIEPKLKPKGPKKVLQINDAAFALPDDFNGTIQEAMKLFLEYHQQAVNEHKPEIIIDQSRLFTPIGILTVADENNEDIKCCIEARIYKLDKSGHYVPMEVEDPSK